MTIPHLGLSSASRSSQVWYRTKECAIRVDLTTGRLSALLWHNGYGKFYPTLYLSIGDALRWGGGLWRGRGLWWLCDRRGRRGWLRHPWPYLMLQGVRFTCFSLREAQEALDQEYTARTIPFWSRRAASRVVREPCRVSHVVRQSLVVVLTVVLAVFLALYSF